MRRIVVVLGGVALLTALFAGPVVAQAKVTHQVYEGSYQTEEGSTALLYITCGPYAGEYALSFVTRGGEFDFLGHYTVRIDENGEPVFEHIQSRDNC